MKFKLIPIFLLLATVQFVANAKAFVLPGARPLPTAVSQAEVIVVAVIVSQTPDSTASKTRIFSGWQLAPSAQYTFHILATLKGRCANNLQIHLPEISSLNYGEGRFTAKAGNRVLLLLNSNSDGVLFAVDNAIPLIRLDDGQPNLKYDTITNVLSQIVSLLLSNLSEATLRTASVTVLKDVVDASIPVKLFPYLDSSDIHLRAAVLFCMATNQQVGAIPRIAELSLAMEKHNFGSGGLVAMCLSKYVSAESVPYLNPLVLAQSYGLRREAVRSLYKIADKTSIPYLILALHDPDSSQNIPAAATVALHRLVPALGLSPLQSHDDYVKHRQEQTKPIYEWWNAELEGQHMTREEQTKLAVQTTLPQTVTELQIMLWSPSVVIRRRVMEALMPLAVQSSIPYLLLALQDPDVVVAYDAYKTLYRIIGTLGTVSDSETFATHRENESKLIYDWWENLLREKPAPIPDATGFIRIPDAK